jgi:hypothetical protein
MPKVKGPLFSVQASGEFVGLMEFRTTPNGAIVAGVKAKPKGRSAAQQQQAARFAVAVEAWRGLPQPTKDAWKVAAAPAGMSGYQLFISEHQGQNIQPPALPAIP